MARCTSDSPYKLEICVDNITSAINAAGGGADRLELCHEISVGGLTPSYGLIHVVKRTVSIPVYVLIRPRSGCFEYSEQELQQMERDIDSARSLGADGFVFGCLDSVGEVDKPKCRRLMKLTSSRPTTFHRAFDVSAQPERALEDIIELGFNRLLTSGASKNAFMGMYKIRDFVRQTGTRMIIMPAVGISHQNIEKIVTGTEAKEFHSSAQLKGRVRSSIHQDPVVKGSEYHSEAAYPIVRRMRGILNSYKPSEMQDVIYRPV